jgi:hypothetical protein
MADLSQLFAPLAKSFTGVKTASETVGRVVLAASAVTLSVTARSGFNTWTPAAWIVLSFFALLVVLLGILWKIQPPHHGRRRTPAARRVRRAPAAGDKAIARSGKSSVYP